MAEQVATIGRARRRRQSSHPPSAADSLPPAWPPAWRELATHWLRRDTVRAKWPTLLATAGGDGFETAHDLLAALLDGGWIAIEETWRDDRWQALWVEFLDLPALRRALGLPAPGDRKAAQEAARTDLLDALERWLDDPARPAQATRRDFAQYARGDTKGITSAAWEWLETQADLAACGIGVHTPLLCIAAPLELTLPHGRLDLGCLPDFLGLPPAALDAASAANGCPRYWTLVENRTSFERVARQRATDEGVLWLPGFPPGWWQSAVARLLALAPAPARIACDPDPAGIEIALAAGRVWDAAGRVWDAAGKSWEADGLDWQPWHMDATDLARLPARKPLTPRDNERLIALIAGDLPDSLRALALEMQLRDSKGEQEGYL